MGLTRLAAEGNPHQGQAEIPVVATRSTDLLPSSKHLVHEGGDSGPASAITGLFFASVAFIAFSCC